MLKMEPADWFRPPQPKAMPLIPRWRYMTDEAKALSKRAAVSALVLLLVLMVFRSLLQWVLLALAVWWIWRIFKRS
jgi:hypothetical protein